MIDLQTLTISYGKKVLVDSVNAEFAPGTVYGLVAPNGHGKTTLLRAMAGMHLVRGRCCIPDCVRKITSRWFAICGRMLAISKR